MEQRWWTWVRGLPRRVPFLTATSFVVAVYTVLIVASEYLFRVRFAASAAVPYVTYWLLLGLMFATLVLVGWQRYLHDRDRLLVEAFVTGAFVGFLVAIAKLSFHWELWTTFNLLAEPIRTGLFGIFVAWLLAERHQTMGFHHAAS